MLVAIVQASNEAKHDNVGLCKYKSTKHQEKVILL